MQDFFENSDLKKKKRKEMDERLMTPKKEVNRMERLFNIKMKEY